MAEIVVVRFRAGPVLPYVDTVGSVLGQPWNALQAHFPGIDIRRRIRSVPEARLRSFAAAESGGGGASRLLRAFEVRCPPGIDPSAVVAALHTWGIVEFAYVQPGFQPASVNYTNNPDWASQGYLQPGPTGVNSIGAWQLNGGDGSGRTIVDIEADWALGHRDLPTTIAAPLFGSLSGVAQDQAHGLCTLGVLCAVDNWHECIGMAPNVASVRRATYIGPGADTKDLENAIVAARNDLSGIPGAVILLEVELNRVAYIPNGCVDLLPAVRDAIRSAVDAGIVVVEAAGNGRQNLDSTPDPNGALSLDRNLPRFADEDSGAVLVGASNSQVHTRLDQGGLYSNFGNRVDVYAWGENVTTLYGVNTTTLFDGTSSAAAIIAGAVLQIQGIAIGARGTPLDPRTLRTYLRDPANGTPSSNPPVDRIGVMPDIVRLVNRHIIPPPTPENVRRTDHQ